MFQAPTNDGFSICNVDVCDGTLPRACLNPDRAKFMIIIFQLFSITSMCRHHCNTSICKLSQLEFRKHFQQLLSGLYQYPFLVICQKTVSIWQKFYTFKIRFKMKCTHGNDQPLALAISQIVYLPSFFIISLVFETFACLLQSQVGQILLHL